MLSFPSRTTHLDQVVPGHETQGAAVAAVDDGSEAGQHSAPVGHAPPDNSHQVKRGYAATGQLNESSATAAATQRRGEVLRGTEAWQCLKS